MRTHPVPDRNQDQEPEQGQTQGRGKGQGPAVAGGGNEDQWAELYRREHDGLVRLARLIVGSEPTAQELVHDAFVTVISRSEPPDNPGAYLRTVVVNNCRQATRRADRGRRKMAIVRSLTSVETTRRQLALEPGLAETWDALDCLNSKQRTVVVLRYHLDLPVNDIADLMNEPVGTVKSTLHRALGTLRKELRS